MNSVKGPDVTLPFFELHHFSSQKWGFHHDTQNTCILDDGNCRFCFFKMWVVMLAALTPSLGEKSLLMSFQYFHQDFDEGQWWSFFQRILNAVATCASTEAMRNVAA